MNLHPWTGWGSATYWNAFVANLEMHGKGNFYDPRLDNAEQSPVAAKAGFGHVTSDKDLITPKLAGSRRSCGQFRSCGLEARAEDLQQQAQVRELPRSTPLYRAGMEFAYAERSLRG